VCRSEVNVEYNCYNLIIKVRREFILRKYRWSMLILAVPQCVAPCLTQIFPRCLKGASQTNVAAHSFDSLFSYEQ
jgi:hypothetical protein